MTELEADLVGVDAWAAEELRRKAERRLERMALYRFGLSDDLGTTYVPDWHHHRQPIWRKRG